MSGSAIDRYVTTYAGEHAAFTELVASLSDDDWQRRGANFPQRLNDEDEMRSVGAIAHHVAVSERGIVDRLAALATGREVAPVAAATVSAGNRRDAEVASALTRDDVVALLRDQEARTLAVLRGLTDEQLTLTTETPAGPMSVADRIERVLIGHLRMHRGSIETTLGRRAE